MKRGCSDTKEREGERLGIVVMMYLSPYSSSQSDCQMTFFEALGDELFNCVVVALQG